MVERKDGERLVAFHLKRFPADLRNRAKEQAQRQYTTMTGIVVLALTKYLDEADQKRTKEKAKNERQE